MNPPVRFLLAFLLLALLAVPDAHAQDAGDLIITELMPDPADVPADGDGEYVELYNDTDAALNLNGLTLTDAAGNAFTIDADVTVPGGGFAVLCANADAATNGGVACDYEYEPGFSLNNASETVTVTSAAGATLFEVRYDDGNPFGAGVALELRAVRLGRDGATAQADYRAARSAVDGAGSDRGSPGTAGTTQGTASGGDAVATRLVFQSAPGQVRPGQPFAVTVAATDDGGTVDTEAETQITLSINAGRGALSAETGLTQRLGGGSYTWTGLRYDGEDAFTLSLSDGAGGLDDAESAPIQAALVSPVFFTEYVEGSSQNKALEIYNGTDAAIDLQAGGYGVQVYANGNPSAGQTQRLTGRIAPGDVHVVAQGQADGALRAAADQTGFLNYNGNDALALVYDADGDPGTAPVILDVIGQIGADPGTEWGSGATSTMNNTLRRRPGITGGDADGRDAFDPADEWFGYAQDTFAGLGSSGHARTTAAAGWRMLAAPYDGLTVQDLAAMNLVQGIAGGQYAGARANLYTGYDDAEPNNNGYTRPPGMGTELGAAQGFIWRFDDEARAPEAVPVPFTLSAPAGSTPRTSDVTVSTADTDQTYFLLGNPYDTAYDLAGLSLNADADDDGAQDFSNVVHIWDPATEAGDNTGDGGQPGSYRTLTRGADRVAVWQGFFVERNDADGATATSVTFAQSGQQAGAGVGIFDAPRFDAPRAQTASAGAPPAYRRLPLRLTATDAAGRVVAHDAAATLFFHEDAADGWDAYDATKLSPLSGAATLAFVGAKGAEQERRKAQESRAFQPEGAVEVPLAVTAAAEAAAHELAWPQRAWENIPDGWALTLTDHAAGTAVDLRATSSYAFTPASDARDATAPRFTLTIEPAALPVELAQFTAAGDDGHAVLQWATASETGSAAFEVQHRAPGADSFTVIRTIKAAGTSAEPKTYRHRTGLLAPGTHIFRLRQIDRDNSYSFSDDVTAVIALTEPYALTAPAPNPFSGAATLSFAVREAEPVRLNVYNVLGQHVRTLFDGVPRAGETQTVTLRAGGLPSGLYLVRLTGASFSATRRVVLVR